MSRCAGFGSGFVPRDQHVSFLSGKGVTSCAIRQAPNVVSLPYVQGSASVRFVLAPSDPVTYYTTAAPLKSPQGGQGVVDFSADLSNCVVGDLVWILVRVDPDSAHSVRLTFDDANTPNSPFYVTVCGGAYPNPSFTLDAGSRLAQYFIFDGQKLVNTYDNC